ncbi:glycoside hydrolase family 88 protein [uncultured Arcticibacterium sp.]|uniref:glycoside hydrolase family 88/105 protein n=1 Tax=uncultured Arcticibacterium sp. TaxID=2173042 RepID=UPI0030F627A8
MFRRNPILFFLLATVLFTACQTESEESQEKNEISNELKWSERMALSILNRNPDPRTLVSKQKTKWNYKTGLVMSSLERLHKETNKEIYFDYMRDFADKLINENGIILEYDLGSYNIDNINAGKYLFYMNDKSEDKRYRDALDTLRSQLETHPRTNAGGFWHKKIYPYQMWLDGLYMGAPFYAKYNVMYEHGDKLDDVIHQFDEIQKNLKDEKTGLFYHGWDESRQMDWADKETGRSPEFWLRSLGWYAMALVDVIDILPEDYPKRDSLISYLDDFSASLLNFQDKETGLWYQVPTEPEKAGNYLESSGSAMITYAFARAAHQGYIDESFLTAAEKAYDGIIHNLIEVEEDGTVNIKQVCQSAGLGGDPYRNGTYDYYISEPMLVNDIHALGPFILASLELDK